MTAHIFLQLDLSQVENRIQLMLTRDREMQELARTPPWELDMHEYNAEIIAPAPADPIARKEWRHMGKRTNHAAMRGIGAKRYADELLKDGIVKTVDECQRLLNTYMKKYAPLQTYFSDVRKDVLRCRMLVSSWGTFADFRYQRLDDLLMQKAYSFYPQAEGGGILNEWGWKPMFRYCTVTGKALLQLPVHDSILFTVLPEHAYEVARAAQQSLERPRIYAGVPMTVPVSFALGRTWAMDREWKRLPDDPREFALAELADAA